MVGGKTFSCVPDINMLTLWVRQHFTDEGNTRRRMFSLQVGLVLIHGTIYCSLLRSHNHHHQDHVHNHQHQDDKVNNERRGGRALDNLLDFSEAVLDENTGLKCISTQVILAYDWLTEIILVSDWFRRVFRV